MKQIIFPVLLLCLLLTACTVGEKAPTQSHNLSSTTTTPITKATNFITTTVPSIVHTTVPTTQTTASTTRPVMLATTRATTKPVLGSGNSSYITLTTYEDYLAYISEKSLPLDFIKYDQLPPMGEFGAVQLKIWNDIDGPYSAYVYEIELSSGLRYSVSINHKYKHKNYEHEDISHKGNLRELADKGVGVKCYEQAGVTYKFINGGLNDIEWEYNGIHFIINAMRHSTEQRWDTTNGPDFIQELLHTDTVEKAMQRFKESMEAAAVK